MSAAMPRAGDWSCDTAGQPIIVNGPVRENGDYPIVALVYDSKCPPSGTSAHLQYDEEQAARHAKLIAAAPGLRAAVAMVLDAEGDLNAIDFDMLRTALAAAGGAGDTGEWSGSPCPLDPGSWWVDDDTGERVSALTGERRQYTEAEREALARLGL